MNRRVFIFTSAMCALASISLAQADVLADSFNDLSLPERLAAQQKLSEGGFYFGKVDGSFGPATKSALNDAASFTNENSNGQADFDLTSSQDAKVFILALAKGDLDKWFWGEGNECDGC